MARRPAPLTPGCHTPHSPTAAFSVEVSARVQALIVDEHVLMERLIRFAQKHDLLKKTGERAQKLTQDSNSALETYRRQVCTREEQLAYSDSLYVPSSCACVNYLMPV